MRNKYLFSTVLLLLLISCRKEKTIWSSDWSAPIVNDTLSLVNFVNDSTLTATSDYYELKLHRTLLDLDLSDFIEIPDITLKNDLSLPFLSLNVPPGMTLQDSVLADMDVQDMELKIVSLEKGFVDVVFQNPLGTDVLYSVRIPGISKDGVVFDKTYTTPAGSNSNPGIKQAIIDIAGYTMDLTGENGDTINYLKSYITIQSNPSGLTTLMTNQDTIKATATLRDMKVSYAKGYFGTQLLTSSTQASTDVLSKIIAGSIDFSTTNLKLTISNGVKVPVRARIFQISNENVDGENLALMVNGQSSFQFGQSFDIEEASVSNGNIITSSSTLQFASKSSNIEEYLEHLGIVHKLSYSIQMNPLGNTPGLINEIFPSSKLTVAIDVNMPLQIGADGLTIKDTFDFSLPTQNVEKTHVKSGELVLYCTNAFPISGQITLGLLDATGNLLYTVSGNNEVKSSVYGTSYSSSGLQTSSSTIHFVLSSEIISHLDQFKKIAVTTVFFTPNGTSNSIEKMSIPVDAFLGIKLKGKFEVENQYGKN